MDMNIQKTVLPGNVKVVTEYIPHVRSVAMGIWFNTGSRDESPAQNGITHFFEHMIFKGTARRSAKDIAMELERVGGHLNAFTGKENICLYAQVLDEHVPLALDLLADLLNGPLFSPDDIAREQQVVAEEIRGQEDNPEDHVHELLFGLLWPGHALGRPIAGTQKTVVSFSKTDLDAHRLRALSESEVLVAIAGNIEHGRAVEQVSGLIKFRCATARVRIAAPLAAASKNVVGRDIQQVHISAGFPGIPHNDSRRYALRVLSVLLGEGMSSRLFQRIREEKGLAYSIFTFQDFFSDTGVAGLYVGTDPERAEECQRLIARELRAIRARGISADELAFAKTCMKGNLFLSLESTSSRMIRLARFELSQGSVDSFEETAAAIDAVTVQDVGSIVTDIFDPRRLSLAVIAPRKLTAQPAVFDILLENNAF